jgi:UDP-N-acetylmuramate dehydrogenase
MTRSSDAARIKRYLSFNGIRFEVDVPSRELSSWRIGASVNLLITPRNVEELLRSVRLLRENEITVCLIGCGTNILFPDERVQVPIISTRYLMGDVQLDGDTCKVECGAWVPHVADICAKSGLSGLEHTIGIPGTMGGLVYMNGGSNRHGISEAIYRVSVIGPNGEAHEISVEDCGFSYRESRFQRTQEIILDVTLRLVPGKDPRKIRKEMLLILKSRRLKFPRKIPNCGSVFKSLPGIYDKLGSPGQIVESLGFKGFRQGGAVVSRKHANFIVNEGGALAADVLAIVRKIKRAARERLGVDLPCEVLSLQKDGRILGMDAVLD